MVAPALDVHCLRGAVGVGSAAHYFGAALPAGLEFGCDFVGVVLSFAAAFGQAGQVGCGVADCFVECCLEVVGFVGHHRSSSSSKSLAGFSSCCSALVTSSSL